MGSCNSYHTQSQMIALADCNNFYASCERVFNPQLKNKPVIVLSNNDGCVIARSNEAKALKIKMGEPAFKIKSIIEQNDIYVFSTNFALYGDMSNRVMSILEEMMPSLEIYSIDEAFMDFRGISDSLKFASQIKEKVTKSTGIPISIGVAKTKTLAKIANHIAKKYSTNNVFVMTRNEEILKILKKFPISKIWGIGNSHSRMLNSYGVKTAYDFITLDENWVQKKMTITGLKILRELKGNTCFSIDLYPQRKKSICTSRTFTTDINDIVLLEESIANHATRCAEKLRKDKSCAKYIGVLLNTNPFGKLENYYNGYKSIMLETSTNDSIEIIKASNKLLKSIYKKGYNYKKSGVILRNIIPENQVQLNLFNNSKNYSRRKELFKRVDFINQTMGQDKVKLLAQGISRRWKLKQENLSPCYTTRWNELLKVYC